MPAFAAVTRELQRRSIDGSGVTLPALTGRRNADWAAFSRVYSKEADALPDDRARAAIAAAAIHAMTKALNDNHASWSGSLTPEPYGLGLSVTTVAGGIEPTAVEPAYIRSVAPGSPAQAAGLRLGDEVLSVNGVPLFTNGTVNDGALSLLNRGVPGTTAKVTLRRPATGETFSANLTPAQYPLPPLGSVHSRLVGGNVAYVAMTAFTPEAADKVLAAIGDLRAKAALRGVVLDLRGNGGGSPAAVAKLLGSLAHDKITSYWCDVKDKCKPNRTDDSVALLNLPVTVLTDRHCASACDSYSAAVKDLGLGTLVGTRTAGLVSGPGEAYTLGDGTRLMLRVRHVAMHDLRRLAATPTTEASTGSFPGVLRCRRG